MQHGDRSGSVQGEGAPTVFDAPFVSTSATITQVAEAFAMPESSYRFTIGGDKPSGLDAVAENAKRTAAQLLASTAGLASGIPVALGTPAAENAQGRPFLAVAAAPVAPVLTPSVEPQQLIPEQVGDPAALASLTGLSLLQQLTLLQPTALSDFVTANPEAVQQLIDAPPAARDVELWWASLDGREHGDLLASAPGLVGNLEGVPFAQRDAANRAFLASSIAELTAAQQSGRTEARDASTQLQMLQKVNEALVTPIGAPQRHLLSLDPAGAGTASIAIGDVASAAYVSILVPGMFYTVDGQMAAWTTSAQNLYDEQVAWVDELGLAGSVATVAWIGYETPSFVNFTSLDLAYQGSDALSTVVAGLHALRGSDQPYLSLIAHSYGSTTAMMALTDYGIEIDSIGIIGSPGSSAQLATDLGVPGNSVFVGEADWDQVKDSAFFGSDPGSDSFGAYRFEVSGGTDPLTGAPLIGSTGHDEYLEIGSESLRNLALVGLGQGRLVTLTEPGAFTKASTDYSH